MNLNSIELKQIELFELLPNDCKYCGNAVIKSEDNRFDVPARFKGDRTIYGEITHVAWCNKINAPCPDECECEE